MADHPESNRARVYLDHAATSWPKFEPGVAAAERYVRCCGATAGRGAYHSALEAERWVQAARKALASLIGAPTQDSIALCTSGTHALNAGLWGVLKPGDHVLTTAMEHNSLLRPLHHWKELLGITVDIVPTDERGIANPLTAMDFITPKTRLVALGHASNVTGAVQDLEAWSQVAQDAAALFMVDASQTLGYLPIDVRSMNIDVLAAAGHKGLRALHGTGFLHVAHDLQAGFRPLLFGGTGRASESMSGGQDWPNAVEVGNLNLPGIVSMAVAAEHFVESPAAIHQWQAVHQLLLQGLQEFPQVRLLGRSVEVASLGAPAASYIPVVSLSVDGWDVHDLASVLDDAFGIEVRAGWHCAALVHKGLVHAEQHGASNSGTLRLSTGASTTVEEVTVALRAFREILKGE